MDAVSESNSPKVFENCSITAELFFERAQKGKEKKRGAQIPMTDLIDERLLLLYVIPRRVDLGLELGQLSDELRAS